MKSNPLFIVTCLFSLLACTDEMDGLFPDPLHPNQKTFKSSLFIEVKNTEGKPVYNALVQIGNAKGQTNTEGFLYLRNTSVSESSYLTVEKEGYFYASRRFYPAENKSQFVKLIVLPNDKEVFFTSSVGRTISFEGGVTLNFPKDAYEYKTGTAYNGEVIVAEYSLPADDPDLSFKMPGDLTGIDLEGMEQGLGSFGMMAVELRSSSGELLQLKKNTGVEVQIVVPDEMVSGAPSTLPMWYFDEIDGIWREEGEATLTGNVYSATVHHFSYWNCDASFPTIKWGATFKRMDDFPLSQVRVCITINELNTTICEYTNENGWVSGRVASGKLLSLNVYTTECHESIYSAQIGPFTDDVTQGPIIVSPPPIKETKITGIAIDCDSKPVRNGYVVIDLGNNYYYETLDPENGAFSSTIYNCDESNLSIFVVDVEKSNYSSTSQFSFSPSVDVDTIFVCKSLEEYIVLEADGFYNYFTFPYPSFWEAEGELSVLYAGVDTLPNRLFIGFIGKTTGNYTSIDSSYIQFEIGIHRFAYANKMDLNITHFGEVGDYVQGTLSGDLYTDPGNANPTHTFTGSFSVLRR